jgi:hypothetical protein
MMKVKASDLADALKPAKPHPPKKRPKPLLVSLEHELVAGTLTVIEAKHGAFAKSVPASGEWPGPVQVDGVMLYRLVATWPPETELELSADAQALTVRMGKSVCRVARTDGGGANPIKRTPPKPDKRHKGKVEVPPDPEVKRVELADTWAFSARVPMPQHRDPKDSG